MDMQSKQVCRITVRQYQDFVTIRAMSDIVE
jgi:hypothetical protein